MAKEFLGSVGLNLGLIGLGLVLVLRCWTNNKFYCQSEAGLIIKPTPHSCGFCLMMFWCSVCATEETLVVSVFVVLSLCVQCVSTRCMSAVQAEYQPAASTPTSSQRKSPTWVTCWLLSASLVLLKLSVTGGWGQLSLQSRMGNEHQPWKCCLAGCSLRR